LSKFKPKTAHNSKRESIESIMDGSKIDGRRIPGEVIIEEIDNIGLLKFLLEQFEKSLKTDLSDDMRTNFLAKKVRVLFTLKRLLKTNLKSAK
jgi:hypothetical protein